MLLLLLFLHDSQSEALQALADGSQRTVLGNEGTGRSAVHGHINKLRHMLFSKDGRKITNGDCALFQAGDAPPFIAKISYQIVNKDGDVRLGVNWLYRPGDVKLGKIGEEEEEEVPLPPNEVFYSFHKDEIPGASLLHPCKVAFLGKGVDLPSGVSSFVCRRVYDITSKCLWWLTDRDYTNEHQEEVDELLNKTRNEMQVTMPSGLSPRTVNVSAQLKVGSDTIQNGSLAKGKKREHADHNNEPPKRGRFSRPVDSDSGHLKQECNMRLEEIIDITDRDGSILNSVGVEHLVHLMRQDRKENMKKGRDLVLHRTMLVGVIATTEQEDCLSQFVHSGGLSILDDWLQEAHKGKSGDSGSPKEGEKAHEDLLLVLLQVLGRLPVDLEALKTCNVGKSVNHLRNHKNLDIHKKARCLVDTWKRRVDEEMKNNDTQFGSEQGILLPCKQGLGDFVPEHGIKGVESTEITSKGLPSLTSSLKAVSSKLSQGDAGKGASVSPSSVKVLVSPFPANTSKDSHHTMPDSGTTDLAVTKTKKEDKSSNSKQSQSKSQSCSSSHAISASSVLKEDVLCSAVGSISSKVSHFVSPHKMPNKGVITSVQSGSHKESEAKSLLLSRNTADEKDAHVSEKEADNTQGDGSQRLIVRLPNPSHSPARSLNCGSNADKIIRGSQGPPSDKNGRHEGKTKTKMNFNLSNHSSEFNTGSLQSNRARPFSANPVKECSCNSEDGEEFLKMSKTSEILSPGPGEKEEQKEKAVEAKKRELHESAGIADGVVEDSSIHSKATLLASVISTEISKVEYGDVAELGTTVLMTGEDNLGQDTKSRCHSKTISARLDDVLWQNALDLKKDCDSMEECQKVEFTVQEHDSHHFSNRALEPGIVAEVGEGNKGSLDDMIWEVSVKHLSWENDNARNKMEDCMLSSQGVEQTREMLYTVVEKLDSIGGGPGLVCAEQETKVEPEEHTTQKLGEVDNIEHTKLHAKDIIAGVKVEQSDELCLEKDKEEIVNRNQVMATDGYDACSRVSNSDVSELKVDNSGIIEDSSFRARCQDPKEVGYEEKAICTKYTNKDVRDVSSCNEQPKIIASLDVKEQCCTYIGDNEDKVKDEDADGKHLLDTKNLTGLDESQETMTKKRKYNEVEKTLVSAEGQEVNQEIDKSGIVHKKNATTEMGCEPVLDIFDDKMKVDIEECKLSSPLNTEIVSSTCVTHQEGHAATPVIKSTCSDELASSKQDMTTEFLGVKNNGSSIKDHGSSGTAERPDFDLNEAIDLDGAVQHEVMISIPESSLSVAPCANASVVCTASTSGLATPITVVAASKGPFNPPVNSVCSIGELGWKGSAATSAFRPAESRKNPEQQHLLSELVHIDAASVIGKRSGAHLDIDLNVADEGTFEEEGTPILSSQQFSHIKTSSQHSDTNGHVFVAPKTRESAASDRLSCSHIKPDLDLNCTNESLENGLIRMPLGICAESFQSTSKTSTGGLPHSASHVPRNFDLNDGPCLEDTGARLMAHDSIGKGSYSSCPTSIAGMRMNGEGLNLSSWSPRNGVQALAMASYPSARVEHPAVAAAIPHSNLSSLSGFNFFGGGDIYKGGKISLSSDPSVSFSNTTAAAYSFAGFPFGSNFPLTSASFSGGSPSYPNSLEPGCFPAISSQIVNAGPLSSSYVRPYMMNPMGVSGAESSGTWPKQNLDLNRGPGIGDMDLREDVLFSRHISLNSPVSLEHMGTLCQPSAPGVLLKRKESGGWDLHRPGCNQPWQ